MCGPGQAAARVSRLCPPKLFSPAPWAEVGSGARGGLPFPRGSGLLPVRAQGSGFRPAGIWRGPCAVPAPEAGSSPLPWTPGGLSPREDEEGVQGRHGPGSVRGHCPVPQPLGSRGRRAGRPQGRPGALAGGRPAPPGRGPAQAWLLRGFAELVARVRPRGGRGSGGRAAGLLPRLPARRLLPAPWPCRGPGLGQSGDPPGTSDAALGSGPPESLLGSACPQRCLGAAAVCPPPAPQGPGLRGRLQGPVSCVEPLGSPAPPSPGPCPHAAPSSYWAGGQRGPQCGGGQDSGGLGPSPGPGQPRLWLQGRPRPLACQGLRDHLWGGAGLPGASGPGPGPVSAQPGLTEGPGPVGEAQTRVVSRHMPLSPVGGARGLRSLLGQWPVRSL